MKANDFIVNLKADNSEKDNCNLQKVIDEYKCILNDLPAKDRGSLALNVLRTLCWNIDKSPLWRDSVDNQALLTLSIDCVRETRVLNRAERVKALACIYHLHKHAVKLTKSVPPELVLKISFMPFELDSKHLLQEYYKTYWNILVDRLYYIERLKTKVNIGKLLPKLTEDITKVIQIYDSVQFCSTIIVFLIKKLHVLYNETHAKELSQIFSQIFAELSKKDDLKSFKGLSERENLEIYIKLNDSLYIIIENASKLNFKDCKLDEIVRTCIALVGHNPDLFHCLQMFYQNCFCSILTLNTNLTYTNTILSSLQKSLETTEKLGYKKAIYITYPYLSQLLRLYIEYNVTNSQTRLWIQHFDEQIQENCLKLILFFMRKLKNCEQLLKCESCHVKTGLHDSLRLSLLIKHFVTTSLSQNLLSETILVPFYAVVSEQYAILTELNNKGCPNHQKLFRKLQTDIHNTAISLNKAKHYEYAIKLFDIYLEHELSHKEIDYKNISRALFNKSICELDYQSYENALIDAFISLTFARQDGLETDKYISLVMDIKAKELKSKTDNDEDSQMDSLQLVSVLDACTMAVERKMYGDLVPYLSELKLSVLLKHEFSMYAKLWPSIAPIGGVWKALVLLSKGELEDWMAVEQEESILDTLYAIVLETPSVVRTIHSEYFSVIVQELLDKFDKASPDTPDARLVHAALLLLQLEYDLAAAGKEHGWKSEPVPTPDPDLVPSTRTVPQEHSATRAASLAVRAFTELLPSIQQASPSLLRSALSLLNAAVPLLLTLSRALEGRQLAFVACKIADIVGDDAAYLQHAGFLLSPSTPCAVLDRVTSRAARGRGEAAIVFLCNVSLWYNARGERGAAARVLRAAHAQLLRDMARQPHDNMELAVGRVLYAQAQLRGTARGALVLANTAQRHYLAVATSGTKWSHRRARSLQLRLYTTMSSLTATHLGSVLRMRGRARAAAGAALGPAAGHARVMLWGEVAGMDAFCEAQSKIDNLKYTLGLQPTNESQPQYAQENTKITPFTPKQDIETMLDNMVLKRVQRSPSLNYVTVPSFKMPELFNHSQKCNCFACDVPLTLVLACKTIGIEAIMYARANETEIAKNYFGGVVEMFEMTGRRLKELSVKYKKIYEGFVVDSVIEECCSELKKFYIEVLIEMSFFELKNNNYDITDDYIVKIHELLQEVVNIDEYLSNEVLNLMVAEAQLKKVVRKPAEIDLEEFKSLRLSPLKFAEPPKTPVNKISKPPEQASKVIVKKEELPQKRKIAMKLNLDDDEKDFEKPNKNLTRFPKKDEFKIPNPKTSQPILEIATPMPTRSLPKILVTQPSEDVATPKTQLNKTKTEFFTPAESTPDQFFTPMESVKTYAKKSLRQNIAKNLEKEFSTPKTVRDLDKENKVSDVNLLENEKYMAIQMKNVVHKEKKTVVKDNSVARDENSMAKERNSMAKEKNSLVKERNSVAKGRNSVAKEQNLPPEELKRSCMMQDKSKDLLTANKTRIKREAKKTLVRAVSPGKLKDETERDSSSRQRRLRTKVNFSIDEDDKKL